MKESKRGWVDATKGLYLHIRLWKKPPFLRLSVFRHIISSKLTSQFRVREWNVIRPLIQGGAKSSQHHTQIAIWQSFTANALLPWEKCRDVGWSMDPRVVWLFSTLSWRVRLKHSMAGPGKTRCLITSHSLITLDRLRLILDGQRCFVSGKWRGYTKNKDLVAQSARPDMISGKLGSGNKVCGRLSFVFVLPERWFWCQEKRWRKERRRQKKKEKMERNVSLYYPRKTEGIVYRLVYYFLTKLT